MVSRGIISSKIMNVATNSRSTSLGLPSGFAFSSDDDRPHQTFVRFCCFIAVRVIPPDDRTRVSRAGSAAFIREPVIGKLHVGPHRRTFSCGNVCTAFTGLVITQAMRMDAMRMPATVQELDNDVVTNFGADDGPEDSQPLRLRLAGVEGVVGVLEIAGLVVFGSVGPVWREGPTG